MTGSQVRILFAAPVKSNTWAQRPIIETAGRYAIGTWQVRNGSVRIPGWRVAQVGNGPQPRRVQTPAWGRTGNQGLHPFLPGHSPAIGYGAPARGGPHQGGEAARRK